MNEIVIVIVTNSFVCISVKWYFADSIVHIPKTLILGTHIYLIYYRHVRYLILYLQISFKIVKTYFKPYKNCLKTNPVRSTSSPWLVTLIADYLYLFLSPSGRPKLP